MEPKQPVSANDQHCTNEIDFCETDADLIRQWTRIRILYRIIEWLLQHPKSQNDDEEACSADRQDHLLGEDCSVDMTDKITCFEAKLAHLTDKITCLEEKLAQLTDKITCLEEKLDQLTDKFTCLEEKLAQLTDKITCLEKLAQLTDKITWLEKLAQLTDKITCLEKLAQLTDKITCLEKLAQLTDKITCLEKLAQLTDHSEDRQEHLYGGDRLQSHCSERNYNSTSVGKGLGQSCENVSEHVS